MNSYSTSIPEVLVFEPEVHGDTRGFVMETWRMEWFSSIEPTCNFVQDNHSKSDKGTLRGLHFQVKNPQGKFIRVVQGEIYDAVVDMRKSSPTFGQWEGITLSDENKKCLWVPPGFAHGFYVTSDTAEIIYKCTDYYAPEHERSLLWDDPQLGINWPLLECKLLISEKDAGAAPFSECETYS